MSDAAAASSETWKPKGNPWLIAVVVTVAAFMEVLDTTIVNVSLPHIAGSLSASYDDATWALTSYLVANGIVLTLSGWLSDLLGRKRYFMICIGMFTVCSFLCGISQSLPQLIIFRLLQGFFGGGLQPNQQSIILDTFDRAQRGRAMAIVALATICAPIIGPTLGGYITDNYTWRWVFFMNIPVGILGLFGVAALVEDPPWIRDRRSRGIDYVGIGLIALGLGCLQVMLDRGEDEDWFSSPFIRVMGLFAFLGILGAIGWLLSARNPVLNLRALGNRNFALGVVMIGCMAFILYSGSIFIPQLAQQVLGYSATLSGLLMSPGGVVVVFLIPLVTRSLPIVRTKYLIGIGFTLISLSFFYSSILSPDISFLHMASLRTSQAMGLAFLFVPISVIAYSTLPRELNGDATAIYTMFRNVFGSVGISTATALVTQRTQTRMSYLSEHLNPYNPAYRTLLQHDELALRSSHHLASTVDAVAIGQIYKQLLLQSSVLAYTDAFRICGIAAMCVVPMTFLFTNFKPAAGAKPMGGH